MDSMKTYAVLWLSGVIAGLILVERWRRAGGRSVPAAESAEEAVEAAAAITPSQAPPEKQRLSVLIVTGAKVDAQRARQALNQVAPWRSSDPSFAQLRRWSRTMPPANKLDHPT